MTPRSTKEQRMKSFRYTNEKFSLNTFRNVFMEIGAKTMEEADAILMSIVGAVNFKDWRML